MALTNKCLKEFIESGKMTKEQGKALREQARKIAKKRDKHLYNKETAQNDPELLKQAAFDVMAKRQRDKQVEAMAIEAYSRTILEFEKTFESVDKQFAGNWFDKRSKSAVYSAASMLAEVDGAIKANTHSVEKTQHGARKMIYSQLSELVDNDKIFRGNEGEVAQVKFLKELYEKGSSGKDGQFRKLAESWEIANKMIVDTMNMLGSNIAYNKEWRIPQSHDIMKIKDKVKWVKKIKDKLDWDKMADSSGDAIPFEKRDEILEGVFDTITTQGMNKINMPTTVNGVLENVNVGGKPALRNKYQEERFLIFKDAQSQYSYSKDFGNGNIVDDMYAPI